MFRVYPHPVATVRQVSDVMTGLVFRRFHLQSDRTPSPGVELHRPCRVSSNADMARRFIDGTTASAEPPLVSGHR